MKIIEKIKAFMKKNKPNKKYYSEEEVLKILNEKVSDVYDKLPKLIQERTCYEKKFEDYLKLTCRKYSIQKPIAISVNGVFYVTYPDFIDNTDNTDTIIEIDGPIHLEEAIQRWDSIKTMCWQKMGYNIWRINNSEVDNFGKPEEIEYDDALAWEADLETEEKIKMLKSIRDNLKKK